jgi:excisionase family DNA binding protein
MMEDNKYLSIAQVAKILGISRVAVYKKVKKGDMAHIRIGKMYAIPKEGIIRKIRRIKGHPLGPEEQERIKLAVDKTVKDYGEVLKKLGEE